MFKIFSFDKLIIKIIDVIYLSFTLNNGHLYSCHYYNKFL
jgi:hypothetical protein